MRRRLWAAEPRDFAGKTLHLVEQFLVTHVLGGWLLADKRHCSSRFEDALVDLAQRGEALFVSGGLQLWHGNELLPQMLRPDFAVFDQHICPSFDYLVELTVIVKKAHNKIVGDEKRSGSDDSSQNGV